MIRSLLILCLALATGLALMPDAARADERPDAARPVGVLEALSRELSDRHARSGELVVSVMWDNQIVTGVIVGTPRRIVIPWRGAHAPGALNVRIDMEGVDPGWVGSRLLAMDPELGVAVMEFPEAWKEKLPAEGLTLISEDDMRPGSLVLARGEGLQLGQLRGLDPVTGDPRVSDQMGAPVLLDARGRLVGLRTSHHFTGQSCSTCHVPGSVSGPGHHTSPVTWTFQMPGAPATPIRYHVQGQIRDAQGLTIPQAKVDPRWVSEWIAAPEAFRGAQLNLHRASRHTMTYLQTSNWPRHMAPTWIGARRIQRALDDLEAHGRIRKAYVGLVLASAKQGKALAVESVLEGSPAAEAGIAKGAVILQVDGAVVRSEGAFARHLLVRAPGEPISLQIEGRLGPVRVVLGDHQYAQRTLRSTEELGLVVVDLTPEMRVVLDLPGDGAGAVVARNPTGNAKAAGLHRFDQVLTWNGLAVRDVTELETHIAASSGEKASLEVRRGGKTHTLEMALTPPRQSRQAR